MFRDRIIKLRRIHSVISIFLFIFVLSFCSFVANDLELSEISLSTYGIDSKTNLIWNITLFIIGILLYLDVLKNMFKHYPVEKSHSFLYRIFTFSSICLLLTAVIPMTYDFHNYTAIAYFLGFTISIFLFGYKLLKVDFRIGVTSIVLAFLSAFIPTLLVLIINGLAIPEIVHTIFILLWVIMLSYDTEYKTFLKKIGL